ncbi:MAG: thioredoxin family protein [Thermoplasmata archaeon]
MVQLTGRSELVRVDDATFDAEVIRSPVPVVVDFYADWCAPCRVAEPVLLELSNRLAGKIKFARVNVDEATVVTQSFGIQSIPTYLFVASGTERGREIGPLDPVAIRAMLKRYFPARSASGGTPATR